MRFSKLSLLSVIFLVVAILGYNATSTQKIEASAPKKEPVFSRAAQVALQYVAQTEGTPLEDLIVVNEHKRTYPSTRSVWWGITVLDRLTRRFHQVLVDATTYRLALPAEVEAAERKAYLAQYGKLEPKLWEQLEQAKANDLIPVAIWLTETDLSQLDTQLAAAHPGITLVEGKPLTVDDPTLLKQIRREQAD